MNMIEGITIRWAPWTAAAVLNHLWQSSLVAVVIFFFMLAAKRASARTRWIICWIGLIKFALPLIWFNATVSRLKLPSLDFWNYLPASFTAFAPGVALDGVAQTDGSAHAVTFRFINSAFLLKAGFCIWVAGAILLIGTWFFRGYRLRGKLLATAEPISADLGRRVELASARAGLPDIPHCVTITEPSGPGVVGVLSTIVVLPRSLEDSLSIAELDSVLIHEFTHLKRRDPFLAALQAVVVRLYWFNPLVWFLDRNLYVETEKSCDEAVLDITADAKVYAGGIVKIVRQSLGLQEPGFAGATGIAIVERVKNILARSASPHRRRPMSVIIGFTVALVAFSGFSGAIRAGVAINAPTGKVLVVRNSTPWTQFSNFETEFGDLGYASATIKPADMETTDFSKYSLIVIPGTQGQRGFTADYAKVADRFDRFVQSGGTLLLEVKGAEGGGILRQCFRAIPAQSDSGETRAP